MSDIERAKKLFFEALSFIDASDFAKAESRLREALPFSPTSVSILTNLAVVLLRQNKHSEAREFAEKSIAVKADNIEALLVLADCCVRDKKFLEALDVYQTIISLDSKIAEAHNNCGIILGKLGRFVDALASYDSAIAIEANFADAHMNRGNALRNLERYDDALVAFDRALSLKPDLAEAWLGRGNVFYIRQRHDDAFAAYDKAFLLNPDLDGVEGSRLHAKMRLCNWSHFNAECAHLISSVRSGFVNTQPFPFLAISSSAEDQLKCAELWIAAKYPSTGKPVWRGERYDHDRIRVAYLSADFREHPVSYLMAGIFEGHDKSRFDVAGISLGPDDNSPMRQRLKAAFERFIDAGTYSDGQIADLVRASEIDILVDLMGFTANSRTGVYIRRPAPVQVNYLGYAGTMGSPHFDYILADRVVIPEEKRACYSEKVVYLPDSFMGSDSGRRSAAAAPDRAANGLPEHGFVFCSFNQSYKITPPIFDLWMRLLSRIDDSVLWLSTMNDTAMRNLRHEAQIRKVDPNRIVFAERVVRNEDHLARHQLADLFLDTLPYNAHSTAADALFAGVPVLTCLGDTFAGRVAASLLQAVRIPELITTTLAAYESMAFDLATHPEKLALIKRKLADHRLTAAPFDAQRFTKQIETAYTAMYERHRAGFSPDHIAVPS